MLPTKLNPLGFNPHYDGVMEFTEVENGIYRCYGETTQYQNDGRNLIPLSDYETVYTSPDGLATATYIIKDNRIKMTSDYTQVSGRYGCSLKLTNGYLPQFIGPTAREEYFLPPGTYTISFHNKIKGANSTGSPTIRLTTPTNKVYQLTWNSENYTFTTEEPIAYAHIHGFNYKIDCEFNIQIEAGSTKTEWKPYTTNPTPTVDNPSPIISNYPKGRYKTNLEGITIKLDDDLRGIDEFKDYVEVNVATKEKSITRNVKKTNSTDKGLIFEYYEYVENTSAHRILIRDTNNKWSGSLSTYQAYSNLFKYYAWNHSKNNFYINRRTMDTLLQCFVTDEYLESLDTAGVKKFFTDYSTEFIYPLSNPTTTLL